MKIVGIDFETTGLNPATDQVTEIGAVTLAFSFGGGTLQECDRCGCGRTRLMFGSTHIDFSPDATIALQDVLTRGQELEANR